MPAAPTTADDLLALVRQSGLLPAARLDKFLAATPEADRQSSRSLGRALVAADLLTAFQAEHLLQGKHRGFALGKYTLLDRIGSGGMGTVYLAGHAAMNRRVALKVLPAKQAADPLVRERFLREARAAGSLSHPNIVRAYDIDQANGLLFLVMEFVDGVSLQQLVTRAGPLAADRAGHYAYQAALGLQHAHEAGLVHRDIKPANLLVDRQGIVKLLDLGLARFFHDADDSLTQRHDGNSVLGTADYLAPEQAMDSSGVDIRADVYALGATAYFLLTGRAPFESLTVAQKLLAHQIRDPEPLSQLRPDAPPALVAAVERMMAKSPGDRPQTPYDAALLLEPWGQLHVPPPSDAELPRTGAAAGAPSTQHAGHSRTAPRAPVRVGGGSSVPPAPPKSTPNPPAAASRWPLAAAAVFLLVAVAGGMWWANYRPPAGDPTGDPVGPAVAQPTPPPAPAPAALTVGPNRAGPGTAATLAEAVDRVAPGGTVWIEGRVEASNVRPRGAVTIAGRPDAVWAAGPGEAGPLLLVDGVAGVAVRDLALDAAGGTDAVAVRGAVPGFTLERVTVRNFTGRGVAALDAAGTPDRPATLAACRFLAADPKAAAPKPEALAAFEGACHHWAVAESRFEGGRPRTAAIKLLGDHRGWLVERNRFTDLLHGVLLANPSPAALDVALARNTFHETASPVQLMRVPREGSRVELRANLFLKCKEMPRVEEVRTLPAKTDAAWVWADEGDPLEDAPLGSRYFRFAFDLAAAPTDAWLDFVADDKCQAWVNGHAVGGGPFYYNTRRTFAADVATKLTAGRNVIAVAATNLPNTGNYKQAAGVLARLVVGRDTPAEREYVSGPGWRVSAVAPAGWQRPDFEGTGWRPVRVLVPHGRPPFGSFVFDGEWRPRWGDRLRDVFGASAGNHRDYSGGVHALLPGLPATSSPPLDLDRDSPLFLTYPADSELVTKFGAPGYLPSPPQPPSP